MSKKHQIIPIENIPSMIFTIRNVQVMVDSDLAEVNQVETKVLNQAVKRNVDRFPKEFRFLLSESEQNELVTIGDQFESLNSGLRSQSVTLKRNLRSQIVTSSLGQHGGRRNLPYVFTEQGVVRVIHIGAIHELPDHEVIQK